MFAVESFTRESFIINRNDSGSNPMTAVYRGKMSADGNSVIGDGWKMTWGSALNSIPGNDEELASRRKSPPNIGSMLNRKTPYGLTPLELLRAVLPSPEESELAQYKQDDHNCRTYQNHEACVNAANLKADLIDKGIDVNK